MQIQRLIDALQEHIGCLNSEKIEKIDFDELQRDLKDSIEALSSLQRKEELCDKLLSDFKSEIKRMSLAISRAKGDLDGCGWAERFLSSENLNFEKLIFLREKIREDFNKTFPARPQAKVVGNLDFGGFKINEFKTGAKN